MKQNKVFINGNVSQEPKVNSAKNDGGMLSFSIAVSDGYYDKKKNEWVDKPTQFFNIKSFYRKTDGDNGSTGLAKATKIAARLVKGGKVKITGLLEKSEYNGKTYHSILADSVVPVGKFPKGEGEGKMLGKFDSARVELCGRLNQDARISFNDKGGLLAFEIPVNSYGDNPSCWVSCVKFASTDKAQKSMSKVADNLKKGTYLSVSGELSFEKGKDKADGEGQWPSNYRVNIESLAIMPPFEKKAEAPTTSDAPKIDEDDAPEIDDDDDLPF